MLQSINVIKSKIMWRLDVICSKRGSVFICQKVIISQFQFVFYNFKLRDFESFDTKWGRFWILLFGYSEFNTLNLVF